MWSLNLRFVKERCPMSLHTRRVRFALRHASRHSRLSKRPSPPTRPIRSHLDCECPARGRTSTALRASARTSSRSSTRMATGQGIEKLSFSRSAVPAVRPPSGLGGSRTSWQRGSSARRVWYFGCVATSFVQADHSIDGICCLASPKAIGYDSSPLLP